MKDLFIITLFLGGLAYGNLKRIILASEMVETKDTGPYYIPEWNVPRISGSYGSGRSDFIQYKDTLTAYLFSSRVWRFVQTWKFLNQHFPEVNGEVFLPGKDDVKEWIDKQECKVGKTYETSRDDDCFSALTDLKREVWVKPTVLKTTPPGVKPYRSTCSIYWSCDYHEVQFPVYVSADSYEPYISGPHGEKIPINGDGGINTKRIEDSLIAFYTVKKDLTPSQIDTKCIWRKGDPNDQDLYCNYDRDEGQITVIFKKGEKKVAFNNFIFYRPELKVIPRLVQKSDSDAATKGDLRQLETKTLELYQEVSFLYNTLVEEIANIKHIARNLILSTAKIDDNLIGKIARIPVKTKWLDDERFILSSSTESIIHSLKNNLNNSCLGSYTYINGRWTIGTDEERKCSNWNTTTVLNVLENRMQSPMEILTAPEYRNASSEYTGWTFLDNGKTSLDWLDKGLKYYGKGGFDFNLGSINLLNIMNIVLYIIVGIIAVVVVTTLIKMLR